MQFIAQLVGNQFASPEGKDVFRTLIEGDTLTLTRDPGNKYDVNAIQVRDSIHDLMLGHINKEVAIDLAKYLDGDSSVIAEGHEPEVTCTVLDFVNPKKPNLLIEVTTGYEIDTTVEESDDGEDDEASDDGED